MNDRSQHQLNRSLGTREVLVAGVALVVAASTLVSDFTGFFTLGAAYVTALLVGFSICLLLGLSASALAVAHPRAGGLYEYGRAIFKGNRGRFIGTFLGLSFFGMFAFAASGEVAAGAFGLRALLGSDLPIEYFIIILSVLAVIPNILGIQATARVSATLLLLMLGIRWSFGIAGFLGLGETGNWSSANLDSEVGLFDFFGDSSTITAGLALGLWGFVGIEFAGTLAEEVKQPRKALPRGIILGLFCILATSLVMGLGVTGTAPLATWREVAGGALGSGGQAPQLAVGQMMFGEAGRWLMALASTMATLGTLTVAYAAMPRIIYSIARDGLFLGRVSKPIGSLHSRFGTPVAATLLTLGLYLIPALHTSAVIEWVYSATYIWISLYIVFHLLALFDRTRSKRAGQLFKRRWFTLAASAGIIVTLLGLYYAFDGSHGAYAPRALVVLLSALGVSTVSYLLWKRGAERNDEAYSFLAEALSTTSSHEVSSGEAVLE